jgi:tetratricopeptide (TPR) repeat protein
LLRGTARQSDSAAPGKPASDKALLAAIVILTALVFLPALRFAFVYDDQGQIVENVSVHSWRHLPEYFQGHAWQYAFPDAPANYYRPMNLLWFRINHALFGLRPMAWHASSIVLHLLATALVFFLVRRVAHRSLLAAVAALLFAVHPTRHEVVAWISGTTESLCAVLFLSAFLAYLKSRERWTAGWMSASLLLYAAALLAKETAIVLPALIFTHALLFGLRRDQDAAPPRWPSLMHAALRASWYLPIALLYLAARIHVLGGFSNPLREVSPATSLLTVPSVLFFYLKQWLYPVHFSAFYDLPLQTRWNDWNVLFPMALFLAAAAALWFFRRKFAGREVVFALSWMTIPLLPALNFSVFAPGELVHDRYYYLPGLGAALLVALALQPLAKGKLDWGVPRPLALLMLALVLPLSYSTASASSYWVDDYRFFEHAHRVAPQNANAQNGYALQLANHGDPGAAMILLRQLADRRPDYFLANYNLGRLLYEVNLLGPAELHLEKARAVDSHRPDTYLQLALICLKTGRLAQAESHYRRALALRPGQAKYHFALGVVLAQRGNCQAARSEFTLALSMDPEFKQAREQMHDCEAAPPVTSPRIPPRQAPHPVARPLSSGDPGPVPAKGP